MSIQRRVLKLPEQLANQIAAGEVVARPASVIKELLENALDAGARTLRVEVDGGGVQRMLVVDDGIGMDADDARMALERHATSKLERVEDLHAIATFGFRGEALPSIASVSRLELRTRRPDATEGVALASTGGSRVVAAPWGGAPGTAVEVWDLFYNVPARRKFLRAPSTESAHVGDVVRAVALSHPGVHVELMRDGRRSKRWLRVASREERVRAVLDDGVLHACDGERGPVRIEAYLSPPERSRTGSAGLHLFVCGRPVQDRSLARAVATAFGDALERGRFPVGAVFISLPLDLVDVNVHPQKAEVRFAHPRAVSDALHSVVSAAFARAGSDTRRPIQRTPSPRTSERWQWPATPSPAHPHPHAPAHAPADAHAHAPAHAPMVRHIGDADAWLLFADDDGVVFVDAERAARALWTILAEREWQSGGLRAQTLLFPTEVAPPEPLASAFDMAARLGFELKSAGDRLRVHTVPRLFAGTAPERLLAPLSDALLRGDDPEGAVADILVEMAAMAPHADRELLRASLACEPAALDAGIVKRVRWDELRGTD